MSRKITENLSLFTPFVLPFSSSSTFLHRINARISATFLKKALRRLGFDQYSLWFYDPEAVVYLDHLSPKLSCYDCVDEYSAMPYYGSTKRKERLKQLERRLVEECDVVFTTSINLYEKKRQFNRNTFLVENVGDFNHFSKARLQPRDTPLDLLNVPPPIAGFVGALDNYKVDFELIDYLAANKPDWSIVLIGGRQNSGARQTTFPGRSNIYCLGRKPYERLPGYVSHFDVCIIPYRINDYTKHVFPIKLFEFLATGKPVVTTALPSLEKYDEIVRIAKSYEDFILSVEQAISSDSHDLRARRIDLAKNNTWESRANKMVVHIHSVLEGEQR